MDYSRKRACTDSVPKQLWFTMDDDISDLNSKLTKLLVEHEKLKQMLEPNLKAKRTRDPTVVERYKFYHAHKESYKALIRTHMQNAGIYVSDKMISWQMVKSETDKAFYALQATGK
jgi:hypothetical protein